MGETAELRYGRMLEAGEAMAYNAERLGAWATGLLESGEWREVGDGFDDPSTFVRSGLPDLSILKQNSGLLAAFEKAAKALGASNRAIGEATKQADTTVARHLNDGAADAAPEGNDASPDQGVYDGSLNDGAADAAPEQEPLLVEPEDEPEPAPKPKPTITLYTHEGTPIAYPEPQGKPSFNSTPGEGISWASWSWNPVTGCLHGCKYCYARELATSERLAKSYPAGFTPLFHPERLDAPAHTSIPARHTDDPAWRRVFVCSMADLYGRWVPDEWIEKVHASMLASPHWEYLLLTKFPSRYNKVELPRNAWVGTSVDDQRRVPIAEDAFRKIDGVKVKWLSLEPLLAPLEFTDLSMFDWVVIGAQTATRQPDGENPAFAPPFEWVARVVAQAREAGCRIHCKPNLLGSTSSQHPGMQMPNEFPNDTEEEGWTG